MTAVEQPSPSAQVFYSSKPRVIHIAINIAVAPILLYLAGIWALPPSLPHYLTFGLTSIIAIRYARARLGRARLSIDEAGLYWDEFYPAERIRDVQTVMRAVRLTLVQKDGQATEKVIGLGWASNADFNRIVSLLTERFGSPTAP